ncbi:MAG: helix-turn-helix transcriptional regulator [Rhodococcus sp.]|nr:helix-turn-helix transcriptional regulator [Rhodococcus sp. (in: high G+C Gram-positive bacteria)]MBJ7322830.1 helix-turn-helix transcriptional regulator [Rhodococcus sp. (in: high G+C Gram-positive bacteria)]
MTKPLMSPADRVRCALHALGITSAEVSRQTGCSVEAVESGHLENDELEKLADHLGLAVEWFYGERPEMDERFLFLEAVVTAGPGQLKLRGKALPASDLPREPDEEPRRDR